MLSLRRAQRIALRGLSILHRLLVGDVQSLVPLRGLGLEAFHHLVRVAVAGLFALALIAGMDGRHQRKDGRQADCCSQHNAHACGVSPRRLAMILSRVRLGNTAATNCRIGSGTIA